MAFSPDCFTHTCTYKVIMKKYATAKKSCCQQVFFFLYSQRLLQVTPDLPEVHKLHRKNNDNDFQQLYFSKNKVTIINLHTPCSCYVNI